MGDLTTSVNSSGPAESSDFGGEIYDEEFLHEIDGLALDAAMSEDVIPTIFYIPRVSGETVSTVTATNVISETISSREEHSYRDDSQENTTGSSVV